MTHPAFRLAALPLALAIAIAPATAQQPPTGGAPAPATQSSAAKTFSQQDLDQLLAPIALYPDALLAQILMASTYPLEVVEAARWSKANPKVTGKALEDAMQKQAWDPAVKALTSVPQVLQQMNDKLDWMQRLGDAFLAQQQDVMNTVQALRAKADAAGNLKSSEQQVVKKETQASQTIYVVESPKPEVVYVPTYNPATVYGAWWYPAPPYYMYPPGYAYAPGLAFATGVVVGAAIWGSCHWGGWGNNNVNVNVNRYNSFNRTNVSNTNWNHNVEHRRGVAYKDQNVARQYDRGGNSQAAQSREQFRGRAESGRNELQNMDRDALNDRAGNADRGQGDRGQGDRTRDRQDGGGRDGGGRDGGGRDGGGRDGAGGGDFGGRDGGGRDNAGNRDPGGRDGGGDRAQRPSSKDSPGGGFDGGGNRDRGGSSAGYGGGSSGFSGAGNGASTREASSRGNASRADAGGGGRGGSGGSNFSSGGGSRASGGFSGGGGARGGGGGGGRGGRR